VLKKLRLRRIGFLLLIVSFFVGSAYLLSRPAFRVSHLAFEGNRFLSEKSLHALYQYDIGEPAVWVYLRHRLFRNPVDHLPQVARSQVRYKWPSTIRIVVYEKKPWLSVVTKKGLVFLSKDGVVLNPNNAQISIENFDSLLILKGIPDSEFHNGKLVQGTFDHLVDLYGQLGIYFPSERIQVAMTQRNHYVLYRDDVLPIWIGPLDALDMKIKNLHQFFSYMHRHPGKAIQYIDLRVPNRVVVKYQ